jgi:hypothetical protein
MVAVASAAAVAAAARGAFRAALALLGVAVAAGWSGLRYPAELWAYLTAASILAVLAGAHQPTHTVEPGHGCWPRRCPWWSGCTGSTSPPTASTPVRHDRGHPHAAAACGTAAGRAAVAASRTTPSHRGSGLPRATAARLPGHCHTSPTHGRGCVDRAAPHWPSPPSPGRRWPQAPSAPTTCPACDPPLLPCPEGLSTKPRISEGSRLQCHGRCSPQGQTAVAQEREGQVWPCPGSAGRHARPPW